MITRVSIQYAMVSMNGMMPNTPGPCIARNRPRRSTTARSQGAATLIALDTIDATTNAAATATMLQPKEPYTPYGT